MLSHLTTSEFKEKIFNYEQHQEWKYAGNKPCIIDFYADWCGPCKMVSPLLEEISKEYEGKLDVFKVNTDEEQELSEVFGIRSIPSILFIPQEGQPQMSVGAMPKDSLIKAIEDIFNIKPSIIL